MIACGATTPALTTPQGPPTLSKCRNGTGSASGSIPSSFIEITKCIHLGVRKVCVCVFLCVCVLVLLCVCAVSCVSVCAQARVRVRVRVHDEREKGKDPGRI